MGYIFVSDGENAYVPQVSDGKAAYIIRAASLAAGIPNTAGASSVNRFCSSGLKAVQDIANQITLGAIECGLALGAESMSAGGDRLNKAGIPPRAEVMMLTAPALSRRNPQKLRRGRLHATHDPNIRERR